jgi:prepilin-type N-terminal cleavage/methylation domain-containing protein
LFDDHEELVQLLIFDVPRLAGMLPKVRALFRGELKWHDAASVRSSRRAMQTIGRLSCRMRWIRCALNTSEMATAEGLCYSSRMLRHKAFTLIELLLVIGIIAVLAGIVITAVNPKTQFVTAQNAKRQSAVRELQNAIAQYQIDRGSLPDAKTLPSGAVNAMSICRGPVQSYCYDLSALVPTYLAALPIDPAEPSSVTTGFGLHQTSGNQVQAVAFHMGVSDAGGPTDYFARWPLQDTAATTAVIGTTGVNGSFQGGETTSAKTVAGPGPHLLHALDFNGSDDCIVVPPIDLSGTNKVTVMAWLKGTWTDDSNVIWEFSDNFNSAGGTFGLFENSSIAGNAQAALAGNIGYSVENFSRWSNGAWHHVAVVMDMSVSSREVTTIYFDGGSVLATNQFDANNTANFKSDSFYLMSRGGSTLFNAGSVADVRIYARALSAAEVAAIAALN